MTGGSTSSSTSSGASSTAGRPGMSARIDPGEHQENGRRDFESSRDHRNRGNHGQQQDQDLDRSQPWAYRGRGLKSTTDRAAGRSRFGLPHFLSPRIPSSDGISECSGHPDGHLFFETRGREERLRAPTASYVIMPSLRRSQARRFRGTHWSLVKHSVTTGSPARSARAHSASVDK